MIVVPDSNIFIAQVIPLDYTEVAEHNSTNGWLQVPNWLFRRCGLTKSFPLYAKP